MPDAHIGSDTSTVSNEDVAAVVVPKTSTRCLVFDLYKFVKDDALLGWHCTICKTKNKLQSWKTRNTFNFCTHLTQMHSDVYRSTKQTPKSTEANATT